MTSWFLWSSQIKEDLESDRVTKFEAQTKYKSESQPVLQICSHSEKHKPMDGTNRKSWTNMGWNTLHYNYQIRI